MTRALARKGDLILVERITTTSYSVAAEAEARAAGRQLPRTSTDFHFGIVASATRDGLVKTWTPINYGETLDLTGRHAEKIGNDGHWTLPAKLVDVTAVLTDAKAHHWPGHPTQPMPYASYDEAAEITRPHRAPETTAEDSPMALPISAKIRAAQAILDAAHAAAEAAIDQQAANIAVRRAQLALALADGTSKPARFEITSVCNGDEWDIIHWEASEVVGDETPDQQALRIAVAAGVADSEKLMSPQPWRVQVFSDPYATTPDGEWTNLTAPCAPGRHAAGRHPIGSGPRREDGSLVLHVRCVNCMHLCWCVQPYRLSADVPNSPWVLYGEPLPGPLPGGIALAVECIKPEHYGMQINDGLGGWPTLVSVGGYDRSTGRFEVTLAGRDTPAKLSSTLTVQLRPAPIEHKGEAMLGSMPMRLLGGTLYNAAQEDGVADTSRWVTGGGGINLTINKWDVSGAQSWAAAELAELGRTVDAWVHHRDVYGDFWRPTFTTAPSPGPGPGPGPRLDPDPDPDRSAVAGAR